MARASDSATDCRPLRSRCRPATLHTTHTPSLFPASSRPPSPSSNPATQSPRSHSTLPSASPELPSSSQSTPPPVLPTSPSLVSRHSPSSLQRSLLSRNLGASNTSYDRRPFGRRLEQKFLHPLGRLQHPIGICDGLARPLALSRSSGESEA